MIRNTLTACLLFTLLFAQEALAQSEDPDQSVGVNQSDVWSLERDQVLEQTNAHGSYCVYIPKRTPTRVLIIAHGTPNKGQSTLALADRFIQRWVGYAKTNKLILIAPSFDRENFGADPNTGFGYGGYRGLFGRVVGADQFVIDLVDEYSELCEIQDHRFLLYGHSAGGQFTIRFSVKHPEKIAAAVACAPGRFAYPAPDVAWPYGMGKFDRTVKWDASFAVKTTFVPNQENWKRAAQLPLTVVYGAEDTKPQPVRPAHTGTTRIEFGTGWVDAMNALTPEKSKHISLAIAPKIGHDSAKLTPICQRQFRRLDWVSPSPLEQYRTWTSKQGGHEIDAIFQKQQDGTVRLIKRDRTAIDVEIDKLSDEDVAILKGKTGETPDQR